MDKVQLIIDGTLYSSRKHLLQMDDINNDQQIIMYSLREKALNDSKIEELIKRSLNNYQEYLRNWNDTIDNNHALLIEEFTLLAHIAKQLNVEIPEKLEEVSDKKILVDLMRKVKDEFESLMELHIDPFLHSEFKKMYLSVLDKYWINHLDTLHFLKEGTTLRSYAQEDPYRLYAFDAYDAFQTMKINFDKEITILASQMIANKEKTE